MPRKCAIGNMFRSNISIGYAHTIYTRQHDIIRRILVDTRRLCEICGESDVSKLDAASIGHTYTDDITDWKLLCKKCHMVFDDRVPVGEKNGMYGKKISEETRKKLLARPVRRGFKLSDSQKSNIIKWIDTHHKECSERAKKGWNTRRISGRGLVGYNKGINIKKRVNCSNCGKGILRYPREISRYNYFYCHECFRCGTGNRWNRTKVL